MAAPLTPLTLPAWGTQFSTSPEAPTSAFPQLVPGTLQIPERTVLVEAPLLTELLLRARAAATLAYAPFSGFRVGAALVMDDDPRQSVITGANVENSSLSLTQCAERTALFQAAALGFRHLRYLAVTCAAASPATPVSDRSPCGACRQVLREFAGPDTLILLDRGTPDPSADVFDIERLLPHGFHLNTRDPKPPA